MALQRNANISSLHLDVLNDIYTIPILEGLRSNVSLKTIIFSSTSPFGTTVPDATSHAIHRLLGSKTSMIQRLEWHLVTFSDERLFRPIAQGIINSECVSELKLSWCRFQGQNCIAQLQSILQNKRNLTSLCLHSCSFGGGQVHEDIISFLSRPDSLLRCFEFQSRGFSETAETVESAFPGIQFQNLLQAVQKSKLERFSIGTIETPHQLQTLDEEHPINEIEGAGDWMQSCRVERYEGGASSGLEEQFQLTSRKRQSCASY